MSAKLRELERIQKEHNLNHVYAMDGPGPGGASHAYIIMGDTPVNNLGESKMARLILFQKGPRKDPSSEHGILDTDLLEIVRDRLIAFQNGPYACEYNEEALDHVTKALEAMNRRVEERASRGVLGTNNK